MVARSCSIPCAVFCMSVFCSQFDLNFDGDGGKSAILVVGAYSNITCWVGGNNTRSLNAQTPTYQYLVALRPNSVDLGKNGHF